MALLFWVCGVVVLERVVGHDHFRAEAKEENTGVPKPVEGTLPVS